MKMAPYAGTQAVARALRDIGLTHFRPGEGGAGQTIIGRCQRWTNQTFATGAVGDYDGDGDADAVDGWKKAAANGRVVPASKINNYADIPAAVMLFWSGGSKGYGHAAVGIGSGQMISTDLPERGKVGRCPIALCEQKWGHKFLGYATVDGNGYDLGSYLPGGPGMAGGAGAGAPTTPTPTQPQEDDMSAEDRKRLDELESIVKARTTVDGVAVGDGAIIARVKKLEAIVGARTTVDGAAVGDTSIVRRIEALEKAARS